ncbi:MAG TPA: 3-hydroxyacyl-CoA dehydrogenase NAD-binding domain-containing protein [Candidatus Sulfotelmatobacter sp.]|jgi:3-hydroxyacyl-CoA dehydrogenase|nr:3-hydroxyacyl-CoA dehydrogenase NAD-binding domain-containing protein [Candidatus Sulfotelmatobacter sp.]
MKRINKVAVLGAGTMGARIAAHFANAGVPSFLFDIVPPDVVPGAGAGARNKIAAAGLEGAKKSKPAAFMDASLARLVTVGNFEDDLKKLAEVDWIIEAVVENLEIKRALLRKVEAIRKPGTIVTTNTSGLPVGKIAEGFSADFRLAWFGTHFFNPPRYMRLLEIIPTPDADQAAIDAATHFCDVRLGKGVVIAKDTPNFIGNRIGTFSVLNVMRLMQEMDLSTEEVDALTGQAVGWPKSATFRTIDLVGLDILGHVVGNMTTNVHDEHSDLRLPDFFTQMIERKWLGDKTKGGFYKKSKGEGKEEERLALDWKTLEYHPRQKPKFAALDMAKNIEDNGARLRTLLGIEGSPQKNDKAGAFLWSALSDLWTYSANRVPEISNSIVEIDRAMRLGFNWELGPFELWDAAGVEATVARMKKEGKPVAANVEKLLATGQKNWYSDDPQSASGRKYWDLGTGSWEAVQVPAGVWSVTVAKKSKGVVKKNSGASLIDLGDGVGCIEFHSKMNSLGADIISLILQTLKPGGPGDNFDAFVITNDATNFSVGANLMLLLMSVQEEEWDDVDLAIRQFQGMTQAIKFSPKPVVSAPFGLCLGGGTEISLHAAARQPHAELYTGLVEVGVGLLPGGGGCKEMLLRAVDGAAAARGGKGSSEALAGSIEMLEAMKRAFETIATAKVATSAHEARSLGFLSDNDRITMNRERVLSDAKARALELARSSYEPPVPRMDIPAPGENLLATLKMGVHMMRQGDYVTDYEVKLGGKIAEVLCGGNVTPGTPVSEQYILGLEREGFKSLCGEKKTQERIQYTLKTGKTLRN